MGKIRVSDLAKKMGINEQDLLFKLRSIGVRVEEQDPQIDTSVIQAILEGKRLPQPREVILRDEEAQASAPTATRRRGPARRLPPNPLRPTRRRPMIQRVEPRIKTIPVTQTPPETPATEPQSPPPREEQTSATTPQAERTAPSAADLPADKERTKEKAPRRKRDLDERPARSKRALQEDAARAIDDLDIEGVDTEGEFEDETGLGSARSKRRAARREKKSQKEGKILQFKVSAPESPVTLTEGMTVREFSEKLGVKSRDLIRLLMHRGLMATINHVLDPDLATELAKELGVETIVVTFEEEIQRQQKMDLEQGEVGGTEPRAPVVTIMGHVDHGKTTLLDAIRSSRLTESEFGGITQHIGAYEADLEGRRIVFVDTPGHEAFTMMRARGAKVTDIVVLVVAADDGVMPQTVEALDHARAAEVPIVVAINKIDKPEANLDRVKKQLAERGLTVEDWGGDTVAVPLSAVKGEGIDELKEMILLTAEMLDLKANPELPASGVVLEARKEPGRGIVSTVLVKNGTLHTGDIFVAGATSGRVRAMTNDLGQRIAEAPPATPVEVAGFSELPEAGDSFQAVDDEAKARGISEFRREEQRQRELAPSIGKASLDQLFDRIQEGQVKDLPVVIKADVQGSVEVLKDTLTKLSTDQVSLQVIHAAVGAITTNDVLFASASGAIIFGFNVRPERNALDLAEKEGVDIRLHTVIYELSDEIKKAMTGLLEPVFEEVIKGRAEVREIFGVPKLGTVAGCHVVEGVIPRNASVRLLRDNVVVYEGKIGSLRRFKDDASEVRSGYDCGIRLDRFQDVKPGDIIEAFIQEEVAQSL